ncbi:MAG: FlgD immunoglobulin-like domain containing protein [Candidatus Krumholzibacteriia bacterium]|nr:hypothetical protein [Candidatus Latescibacterota bacterium]
MAGQFNGAIHIGDCGGGADDCDLYAIGTQANIFIARVASSGDCIWGLSFGNSAEVAVTSLAVDDSGNVFVLGYFQGDIDFGSGEHSATSRDMFIAVFSSADGTLLWDAAFTSSGTDTPRSIALSSSTGFAITGTFDGNLNLGSGILLTPPVGSVDVFAASFSGDLQSGFSAEWGSAFGSTLVDPSYDIATSSAGGVLVACGFHGTLTVGGADYAIADPGGVDDALIMFDDQGAVEWVLALGGSGSDAIGGVAIDAAGSVLVTGYVTGLAEIGDIDFGLNDSVRRGLLAKLDGVDGSTVWVLDPFGASNTGNTTAADVSLDEWDYILVHGHYNSVPLSMGNCTVMTSAPGMFTAKLGGTVTGDSPLVDAVEPGLSVVAAWPNPFFRSTAISYALDRHRQVAIDIVDVQGRHVRTLYEGLAEAGINTVEWDGKSDEGDRAPAGVYFCQMDWGLGRDSKSLCLLR